ncbi:MAG: hypothetical protein PWP67_1518 [Clostridium butyricum]|jgi:hypothetical protein|nr:MAG: hypothetical protein Q607_CBUC00202G0018 [Clostridium butyricum DORA_1]MDK2828709.1 hypothetical protein [Clostridium butyricum]
MFYIKLIYFLVILELLYKYGFNRLITILIISYIIRYDFTQIVKLKNIFTMFVDFCYNNFICLYEKY